MPRSTSRAGFGLVEVLVATLLLSAIALAVTQTLVGALQTRARNQQWMRATALATEGLERLRAGDTLLPLAAGTGFERSATTADWDGRHDVQRIEVTITWNDGEWRTFQLATLVRR